MTKLFLKLRLRLDLNYSNGENAWLFVVVVHSAAVAAGALVVALGVVAVARAV